MSAAAESASPAESSAALDATSAAGSASSPDSTSAAERLRSARGRIEEIDRTIVSLIAERVQVARGVGLAKRELGLPTLDPAREAAVVRRAGELAREAGLADEDVRYLFWHLIGLSRRAQLEG